LNELWFVIWFKEKANDSWLDSLSYDLCPGVMLYTSFLPVLSCWYYTFQFHFVHNSQNKISTWSLFQSWIIILCRALRPLFSHLLTKVLLSLCSRSRSTILHSTTKFQEFFVLVGMCLFGGHKWWKVGSAQGYF
jgi:uncharacterized membrane protein